MKQKSNIGMRIASLALCLLMALSFFPFLGQETYASESRSAAQWNGPAADVTVTATAVADPSKSAACTVTVKEAEIISEIHLSYFPYLIGLRPGFTEGEVNLKAKTIAMTTNNKNVDMDWDNSGLYRQEGTGNYTDIGDGSAEVDVDTEYALRFMLRVPESADWPASVKKSDPLDISGLTIIMNTVEATDDCYVEYDSAENAINVYVSIGKPCVDHDWGVLITAPASLTNDGEIQYQCGNCGEFKSEVIPRIKTVALNTTRFAYDGNEHAPQVSVTDRNGDVVSETYYSVSYLDGEGGTVSSPVEAGTYQAKIVFEDKYNGVKTISFTIADNEWLKTNGKWWYRHGDGSYTANDWEKIDGAWYHFDVNGYMQTGWLKDGGKWYYLKSSGVMATGWVKDGGKWYYLNASGVMQAAKWVQTNYYVNADGVMVTNAYIKNGSKYYWVNKDGKYTKTYAYKDTIGYTIYDQTTGRKI